MTQTMGVLLAVGILLIAWLEVRDNREKKTRDRIKDELKGKP